MTPTLALAPAPTSPDTRATSQIIEAWWTSIARLSPATQAAYRRDLSLFAEWLGPRPWLDLTRRDLDEYAAHRASQGDRASTLARRLSSVASLYAYALDEGAISRSPMTNVRRPSAGPEHVRLTPALSAGQASDLLAAARSPRDRVLVLTLLHTGLRISEALSLDLDAVRTEQGHQIIEVIRKGGKVAPVIVTPALLDAMVALREAEGRETGPVFIDGNGARWERHHANRALARLGRRAGLGRVTPHMLRATSITQALALGASLRQVQTFAAHSSPTTTARYDRRRLDLDGSPAYLLGGAWG